MPSTPLTTRVAPDVHDRLRDLAERRHTTLAATAAALLSAAVHDPDTSDPHQQDGALVLAVVAVLQDVTDPEAVVHRETAVLLARAIERRDKGYLSAVALLRSAIHDARSAQNKTDPTTAEGTVESTMAALWRDLGRGLA